MIPLTGDVVVMPTWVFFLLIVGLVAWNVWLMWANNTQGEDLRRERHRRAVHNHLHHEGPDPEQLRLSAALGFAQPSDGGQR